MEQALEAQNVIVPAQENLDDDWELDVKMCRLDGHAMADGELCEACQ